MFRVAFKRVKKKTTTTISIKYLKIKWPKHPLHIYVCHDLYPYTFWFYYLIWSALVRKLRPDATGTPPSGCRRKTADGLRSATGSECGGPIAGCPVRCSTARSRFRRRWIGAREFFWEILIIRGRFNSRQQKCTECRYSGFIFEKLPIKVFINILTILGFSSCFFGLSGSGDFFPKNFMYIKLQEIPKNIWQIIFLNSY